MVDATVRVLAAWDGAARPAGVVAMPSRSRPLLIDSMSRRIAKIGRLTYLGTIAYARRPGPGGPEPDEAGRQNTGRQNNSAQRLRALWDQLIVPEPLRDAIAHGSGPVLLVDDRIESGWSMTVAAKVLREAGAPAVLPFALAVTAGG